MVTRLDRAYTVEVQQLRLRLTNFASRFWNSMGSWRDGDLERMLSALTPRVVAGQQRISDLTDAYLTRVAKEHGFNVKGKPFRASTENLRGVTDEVVYARPLATMHDALSKGGTVSGAVSAGRDRLLSIVETNLQLAKTHAGRRAMSSGRVHMYERTLTGNENCSLCVIASTQRYFVSDLNPIHPGCDCGQRPYVGDPDQQIIHPDRLEGIHSAVEAEFGSSDRGARLLDGKNSVSDYLDLVTTYEHGEYGPTLSWRDQKHTGIGDIPNP